MAVKIDDFMLEVGKMTNRLEAVEKMFVERSKADGAIDAIRKAFTGGNKSQQGGFGTVGFDGNDQMGLLRIAGNPRQARLGMTEFLSLVGATADGKRDLGAIEKGLDKLGSRPVRKTPLAESSGATGGYTVPVQYYMDLLRLIAEESFVRSRCTTIPMQSYSCFIPKLTQTATPAFGTSAFFGGIAASWQPEAATINESEPTFSALELVARNLVFTTVASNQLLQDNAVALDTLLTTMFREAMGWFYDFFILRGNGAGQPLGVLNAPALIATGHSSAGHFLQADAATMLSRLLMSSWKSAVWLMHQSVLPELVNMTNGATNSPFLTWLNPAPYSGEGGPMAQAIPALFMGLPLFFTEKLPKLGTSGDVLLCDFGKVLVGDRLQVQIEASPWPNFRQNQMMWRIISRWDSQPWLDAPVYLGDGSDSYTVSPYVST